MTELKCQFNCICKTVLHCVQKKKPVCIFFYISMGNV